MPNAFHQTSDGRLDRKFLRVCAVFRLLRQRRIDKPRAIELLEQRRVPVAQSVVEQWLASPLSERGRAGRKDWQGKQA